MFQTPFARDGQPLDAKTHRPYMNKGPQITPRLEVFFQLVGQQGALRFDQAQRWLGQLSPEPTRMKQSALLSAERTRKLLHPWFVQELFLYRVFYAKQRGWLWLTQKGIKYANLNLRYYEPSPASLPHLYAVNEIRLLLAERRPKDTWCSEREIRAQQNVNAKGSTPPHVPNAELISPDGTVRAIEVELTIKAEKRLEAIVFDLATNKHYNAIWYFLPENVYNAATKAVRKLSPEHQKRFVFFYSGNLN